MDYGQRLMTFHPTPGIARGPLTAAFAPLAVDSNNDSYATGGFTGNVNNQQLFLSAWMRINKLGVNQWFLGGTTNMYLLRLLSTNKFRVELRNAAPTNGLVCAFTSDFTFTTGVWYHVAYSVDLNAPAFVMTVNGTVDTASPSTLSGTASLVRANYALGNQFSPPGQQFDVDIAEVFFYAAGSAAWLDLSIASNNQKFRTTGGKPVDLGSDGSTPLGVQPMIYLSRRPGDGVDPFFVNRGFGGNLTKVDGVTGWTGVAGP